MKNKNLALLLLMALSLGTAHAQVVEETTTVDVMTQNEVQSSMSPIDRARMNGDLMEQRKATNEAARAEIEGARENLSDMREEQKSDAADRREATKATGAELREEVKSGDLEKEAAQAQMQAQRDSNQEAAVADRTERVEAKSAIVSKRQAMVDTRIATVREKNPEMADIMEDYYGQIMAKIEAVQAKQSAMLAAVQAGEMTGADARVEFKAYVEVEKADIKALIAEMKTEITALRDARSQES